MNNIELIKNYILSGANDNERVGVEIEHFVFDDNFNIISQKDMSDVLEKAAKILGAKTVSENDFIVEIKIDDYMITLEPGMQLEISMKAVENVYEVEKIYNEFREVFDKLLNEKGYKIESCGVYPLLQNGEIHVTDIKLINKKRYHFMDDYLSKQGKLSRYMMRGTCATQVSIDFKNEKDLLSKLKTFEKLTPFLSLLMENQYNLGVDKKTFLPHNLRMQIWDNMDNDRCGYIDGTLDDDFDIYKLAEFIYNKPFIIDKHNEELIFVENQTGSEYYKNKNLEHVDYYLSMFFHHNRIKKYIEIRCADGNDLPKILGYTALVKSIAYNEEVRDKINNLLSFIKTINDLKQIEDNIKINGYSAVINGDEAVHYLTKIIKIVEDGLSVDEKKYLQNIINTPIINNIYDTEYVKFDNEDKKDIYDMGMFLKNSPIGFYYKNNINLYYLPKIFVENDIKKFNKIVETFYGILNKVIKLYKNDTEIRKLFDFDVDLEDLIINSFESSIPVPMSRIDMFFNEETGQFTFCEINTDGTSSMIEDKILNEAQNLSIAYTDFIKKYNISSFELFDKWVDEFIKYYKIFSQKYNMPEKPNILITDFLNKGITAEFKMFKEYFEKNGYKCEICDIRDLVYKNGELWTSYNVSGKSELSMKVDAVYRRAVTSDIMNDFSAVENFIKAVKDKKVCVVGDFHTQIIHNKKIFYILSLDIIKSKLTYNEKLFVEHHVPYTFLLDDKNINNDKKIFQDILENKNKWILKPLDSYGSKGVEAGRELSTEEWQKTIKQNINNNYIVQMFAEIYWTKNIMKIDEKHSYVKTSNLTNMYCYNEKFVGILSRGSLTDMISMRHDEMTMPTIVFHNE